MNAHLCAWIHDEELCLQVGPPGEGGGYQKEIHIDIHARPRPGHSDFAYNDGGSGITHITADHPGREGVGALPGAPKPSRNSARPPPHLHSRMASAQARARTGVQVACGARSALRARLSFRVAPIPPPGHTIVVYARALLERAAPASYMLRHAIEFAVPAAAFPFDPLLSMQ
ncbi:hypothetical protein FB451DRAFT_1392404 [Mycena latifolia]|nr:hypothetical protein FB451DRAFT_1392404 [Mycena latifolia]